MSPYCNLVVTHVFVVSFTINYKLCHVTYHSNIGVHQLRAVTTEGPHTLEWDWFEMTDACLPQNLGVLSANEMDLQLNAGVSDMVNAERIVAMLNGDPLHYSISLLDFWLAHSSTCFANFKPNDFESNSSKHTTYWKLLEGSAHTCKFV